MENIIKNAENTHILNKSDIINLLCCNDYDSLIFKTADNIRKKFVGNDIHLRALIEFSNVCQNNCLYCGIRRSNKFVQRYTLSKSEIINYANTAINLGYKTIVLQSGESQALPSKDIIEIIKEIKKSDIAITLSLGEKSYEEYKTFREIGADRYLLRIETTDPNLYQNMHPNMSFQNRLLCLKNLKEIGFEVGTGSLVGLPNQSINSLADDILFFKEIDADMIGVGPLITHPQTPIKDSRNGDFNLTLKVMALTRILMPDINIPATTAMEAIQQNGRTIALQCGANVVMPNIMDNIHKDSYNIYPNKNFYQHSNENYKILLEDKFKAIGRKISTNKGYSLKYKDKRKDNHEYS